MPELDRRTLLRAAGIGALASLALPGTAMAAPSLLRRPDAYGAPPVLGLHSTFGDDPARQLTVSWITLAPVHRPRVRIGTPTGGHGHVLRADTTAHTDAASGRQVLVHHAPVGDLCPDTTYVYQVLHGDAQSADGTFRTAPAGRRPFRFTSFGDQSTPVAGDVLGSVHAGDIVDQVEWG